MARIDQLVAAPVAASEYVGPQEYALSDQFKAAFTEYNSLGAATGLFKDMAAGYDFRENQVDFDPYDGTHDIREGYEDRYVEVRNPDEIGYINNKIDQETLNENILASSNPLIGIAAGIVDPVNLLPLSIFGKGKTAVSTALRFAGTTAATEAGIELAQHSTQETRTLEESAINIGMASVMAGAFGGAVHAMSKIDPLFNQEKFFKDTELAVHNEVHGSVGAAKVGDEVSFEDLGPANAFGLEKLTAFQDPVSRLVSSPSKSARAIIGKLAEVPFIRKGSQGETVAEIPVENMMRKWEANRGAFIKYLNDQYINYRSSGAKQTAGPFAHMAADIVDSVAKTEGRLTRKQFNEEVAKSLRRGDQHEIPQVAAAAKAYREGVINPLASEAMKITKKDGTPLLSPDTDLSSDGAYLTRDWDNAKIMAKSKDFDEMNFGFLSQQKDESAARIAEWQSAFDNANNILKDARKEARFLAVDTKNKIKDSMVKASKLQGEHRAVKEAVRKARVALDSLNKRLNEFTPDVVAGDDKKYYRTFLENLQRGRVAKQPVTLSSFVRKLGGVFDDGGELKSRDISKLTTGIINNKSGKTLDEIGEAAFEAGYYNERPDINTILEDLVNDAYGNSYLFTHGDEDIFLENSYIDQVIDEFNRLDINVSDIRDPSHLKKILDNLPDSNVYYREATPAARAKFREILHQRNIAEKRLQNISAVESDVQHEFIKATQELSDARAYGSDIAKRLNKTRKELSSSAKNVDEIKKNLERDKFFGNMDDQELRRTAGEIRRQIVSRPAGRLGYTYEIEENAGKSLVGRRSPGIKGSLKGRSYKIPDLFEHNGVKVEDFLNNDVSSLAASYTRTMSSQISLMKNFGSLDLEDEIRAVNSEFEIAANRTPDQKQASKILRQGLKAERDLLAIRDRILGTYEIADDYSGPWARAMRSIKTLNFMLYLGGMTLSALSDIGRPVMVHGLTRVYKDSVMPLISNRKAFIRAAKEVPEAGPAWDVVLNTTANARYDLSEYVDKASIVEDWLSRQSTRFSVMTFMPQWNTALKQFAGVVAQSRIVDTTIDWTNGVIARGNQTFLQDNYISKDIAHRIRAQFERYGEVHDTVKIPNARSWDDVEARDAFRAAISRNVEMMIVTPGLDKPLSASARGPLGPLAPLIFQFKSFALASMQRTLLTGLQQRDMAALNGAILMTGLGMMTYAIKTAQNGGELSDDPTKWLVEGIDRSGISGWMMMANNASEQLTRGTIGLNALTGTGPMSRYANQSAASSALGPTSSTIKNLYSVIGAASTQDWSQSDTRALRQLMIYNNVFMFRGLFDEAENGINSAFGVPIKKDK